MCKNFKHANAQVFTQTGLYTEAFTQKFFTQMRQMFLHTEVFQHRCFYTQKHLPRDVLTYTRLHTQKLSDTFCPQRITEVLTLRSLYTEIFYTQKVLHTQVFPQKFLHRSFYAQELLHTDAFTHRSLYTRRLLRTEVFAQRSLYTDVFPQKNRFHSFYTLQKIAIKLKFLTFGHHIVRKGCMRRWKIATFDLGQSFCVKGFCLTL